MKTNRPAIILRTVCAIMTIIILCAALSAPAGAAEGEASLGMLAKMAETVAAGKPFAVRVAVCAVMLNRTKAAGSTDTLPAVIASFVASVPGLAADYAAAAPDDRSLRAAACAMRGGDPTRGAVRFAPSADIPADIRESGRVRFESGGFAFWK